MRVIEWVTPWLSRKPVLPIVSFLRDTPLIHPGCHDFNCFPVVVYVRYKISAKKKHLDFQYEVKKNALSGERAPLSACLSVCVWANIDNKNLCWIFVKYATGDLGKSWPESVLFFFEARYSSELYTKFPFLPQR
jgi:hypothetical protein